MRIKFHKNYEKISFFIIFLLFQTFIFSVYSYSGPEELIGEEAPLFKLKSINNDEISLENFRGKIVLLDFFATWCGPCRIEMQYLKKIYSEYKEKNFIIISIDLYEDLEKVKEFVNENDIEWIVVIDKNGIVVKDYLIEAIPTLFLIDKNGIIRFSHVGTINDNDLKKEIVKLYEEEQTITTNTLIIEAYIYPKTIEAKISEQLTLSILINGGSQVQAGEFLFSFNDKHLQLINVTKEAPWELIKIDYNKYAFYRLGKEAIPGSLKIATLIFKVRENISIDQTQVLLEYLKAADANGNDLPITLIEKTSLIRIIPSITTTSYTTTITPYTIEWTPPRPKTTEKTLITQTTTKVLNGTILFIAPITIASICIIALYVYSLKKKLAPKYSFILPNNQIITFSSLDKIFGREDFEKYLKIDELKYITRINKGGQFRIVAKRINKKYDYYIIDEYSTNPTLVNDNVIKGKGYIKLKNGDVIKLPVYKDYLNIIFTSS